MAQLRYGPARVPSRESPEEAIALLQDRGYTACEIDFEGKFFGETLSPTPSRARTPNPYIDTRTGCEHLVEGCTVGQKRAGQGTVQIIIRPATTP